MRSSAPALIPIFRSALQARLLLRVLSDEEPHTIADLARLLDAPEPTVHREVRRLLSAELLSSTRVGRAVLVRPAPDNPVTGPLRQLLMITYGPGSSIERALAVVPEIEHAYIYGSWAARWHGIAGPAPGDVDVLVVGAPDRSAVHEALEGIDSTLGRDVNLAFVSSERWQAHTEPFLRAVHSQPLVTLDLGRPPTTVR